MIDDILGEWDLILGENGRGDWDGRIVFQLAEGRIVVADADPDASGRPSRVELAGDTVRFEMLSAMLILYFRRTRKSATSGQEIAKEIVDAFLEEVDH